MRKLRGFKVLTACLPLALMAFVLVFVSCPEPESKSGGGNSGGNSGSNSGGNSGGNSGTTATYTVTFNANGGSGNVPSSQSVNAGSSITLPGGNGLSRSGYVFGGWNTSASGTGNNYTAGSSFAPAASITLYAKWDVIIYTITFNADGGTSAPAQQNIAHGGKVTEPALMTKTGYGFGGWFKDAALNNQWNFAVDTVTANTTLYAKWDTIFYTVTFNADGGTPAPAKQNIAHGGKAAEPAPMIKTGYGFGGWFREAALINQWDFTTDTVTGDITLYAEWDTIFFTVTFNADGGIPAPAQQNIAHNSKAIEPAMKKTGYTLGGWFKDTAFANQWNFATDIVTDNITLYAKWLPNTVGITLDVKQITDSAPIITDITISRTNNGYPVTCMVLINVSDYDTGSIRWEVAGVGAHANQTVTGSGASFTLNAGDVRYNSIGGHALILTVTKGGQQYQRAIPFTIVQ